MRYFKYLYVLVLFFVTSCNVNKKTNHVSSKSNKSFKHPAELEAKVNLALLKQNKNNSNSVIRKIKWLEPTNRTYFKAQQQNKCMFFYFYSDGCKICEMLETQILIDKNLQVIIEQDFLPVKIEIKTSKIAQVFEIKIVPSFFFLTPEGKVILQITGAPPKPALKEILNIVASQCHEPEKIEPQSELF